MKSENYKSYYHCLAVPAEMGLKYKYYDTYRDEFWSSFDAKKEKVEPAKVDQFGFVLVFKNLKEEKKIQSFLEHVFSLYEGDQLEWLHYTFGWIIPNKIHFEGWQVVIIEKWLTDKIDIYSKMPVLKEPESLTLKDMFSDPKELQRINDQLTKKSFVKNGIWQGKTDPVNGRNPKEKLLAALALVIEERNFLKKKRYKANQMHEAFNNYFRVKTSGYFFKPGQLTQIEDSKKLFYFI